MCLLGTSEAPTQAQAQQKTKGQRCSKTDVVLPRCSVWWGGRGMWVTMQPVSYHLEMGVTCPGCSRSGWNGKLCEYTCMESSDRTGTIMGKQAHSPAPAQARELNAQSRQGPAWNRTETRARKWQRHKVTGPKGAVCTFSWLLLSRFSCWESLENCHLDIEDQT